MSHATSQEDRQSSLASTSSLIALQLLSRLFTFALNQALFRLASPSAFGAASIQFELILSTILFLSREGVRNALLRSGSTSRAEEETTIRRKNLSILPVLAGIPLALLTSLLYIRHASQEIKVQPHFTFTIVIYALAAVTELLSEPLYNLAMVELKTNIRVRAEGLGIMAKCITTLLILLYDSKKGEGRLALLSFAFGQLVYAIVMFATYMASFGRGAIRPKAPSDSRYVDPELLLLSLTMTMQSLVKHFLTEGDKMVLSYFSPLRDQGGYAIAVNYGSLIARVIFQPIEESLRIYFSRILTYKNPKSDPKEHFTSLSTAADILRTLLSVQLSISCILVVFGSCYLPILLPLLLPTQYFSTSAPQVLAAWVWYIPVLAVNGGLEAFLSSVATPKDLNKQSRSMIIFSLIYILSAVFFYNSHLGDSSLVYANIINLSARIVYCSSFISAYFSRSSPSGSHTRVLFQWKDVLPPLTLCFSCSASTILIKLSDTYFHASIITGQSGKAALLDLPVLFHLATGITLGLLCLLIWWFTSGKQLISRFSRPKKD